MMRHLKICIWICVLGSLLQAGEWKFSVSDVYQLKMECKFSGHACYEKMKLHGVYPDNTSSEIGTDDGDYGDREFLDGYVKKDPGTGTAGSLASDYTWYWGYDNASQYDSNAKTLIFHSAVMSTESTRYSSITQQVGVIHDEDSFNSYGICLSGAYSFFEKKNWGLDLQLGVLVNNRKKQHLNVKNNLEVGYKTYLRQMLQWLYTYDGSGIIMPAAGYQGTYEGPFGGSSVSPLIPNRPTDITADFLADPIGDTEEYSVVTDSVNITTDAQFAEIQFGGKFYYKITDRFLCYALWDVLLAYADLSARYAERFCQTSAAQEVLYSREWNYKSSVSKFLWGMGVGFGVEYEFTDSLFAGMSLRKKKYFSDVDMPLAESTVKLDFDCMETKFYIGWSF
ncbi:MAG: hypothetical protein WCS73_09360 [Lentisphaeria bacterium]